MPEDRPFSASALPTAPMPRSVCPDREKTPGEQGRPSMLGLMHDHPYVFTPTIAKIMLPVWVCLLVSTVRAIRRDMKKEKAGDLSKEETDERMGINALVLFFSFAFTVGCLAALTSF
jgi:beta-lactamase regulating signal transducer with metallopeptidase domain